MLSNPPLTAAASAVRDRDDPVSSPSRRRLRDEHVRGRGRRVGATGIPVAVGFIGAGLVVAGLFPTMPAFGFPPGTPNAFPTEIPPSAYVHVAAAIAFFGGMIGAPLVAARRFRRTNDPGWAGLSIAAAIAVLVLFSASSADPSGRPFVPALAGLLQRLAIVAGLGWMVVVAGSVIGGRLR
jgi:hypothetical protein